MKLTDKEYKIVEKIRKEGKHKIPNAQNPTVKNLLKKGLCDFNSTFDALIITKKGQEIDL